MYYYKVTAACMTERQDRSWWQYHATMFLAKNSSQCSKYISSLWIRGKGCSGWRKVVLLVFIIPLASHAGSGNLYHIKNYNRSFTFLKNAASVSLIFLELHDQNSSASAIFSTKAIQFLEVIFEIIYRFFQWKQPSHIISSTQSEVFWPKSKLKEWKDPHVIF